VTALNLPRIKELALTAKAMPGGGKLSPDLVLALIARLEAVEQDANRWRGFIGSARIRPLGAAGVNQPEPNNYAHMGLEIWTVFGRDYSPKLLEQLDSDNALGREWLIKYADVAIAALAARAPMPNDPLDDVLPLARFQEMVDVKIAAQFGIPADILAGAAQVPPAPELDAPYPLDDGGRHWGRVSGISG
jgi:hypothetical protein